MATRNDTFGPFDKVEITENWVEQLREMYPSWKDETNDWAQLPLPNTVVYDIEQVGKKVKHHIRETRNLFLINKAEDFDKLCDLIEASSVVVLDTEFRATMWDGKRLDLMTDEFKLAGVCVSVDPFRGYYIPIGHEEERSLFSESVEQISIEHLKRRFEKINWDSKLTIAQNFKTEVNAFARIGLWIPFTYDTMVGAKVIDNRRLVGLKALTNRLCGYEPIELGDIWKGLTRDQKDFCKLNVKLALAYAASDPVNTFRVAMIQMPQFEQLAKEAQDRVLWPKYSPRVILEDVELPLMEPLARMEQAGLNVDEAYLLDLADQLDQELSKIDTRVHEMVGVTEGLNLRSQPQKEALFFDMLRIPEDDAHERAMDKTARDIMRDKINDYIAEAEADARSLTNAKKEESFEILDGYQLVTRIFQDIRRRGGGTPFMSLDNKTIDYEVYKKIVQAVNEEIEFHHIQLEFLDLFDQYSTLSKLRGTYTTSIVEHCRASHDGLYHTSFTQCLNTGRMSSSPNLQNLPTEDGRWDIRRAFIAPEDHVFVLCDWTAMEMKIAAAVSKCPVLTGIVTGKAVDNDGEPIDIHAYTASATIKKTGESAMDAYMRFKGWKDIEPVKYKKKRYSAKRVNFGILYGITAIGLSAQLKSTRAEAQRFIDAFFEAYPGVTKWIENTHNFAKEHGYTMTPLGRYRRLSRKAEKNKMQMESELKALQNHVIQGCLHGDTKIWTNAGLLPIERLSLKESYHTELKVWDGFNWENFDFVEQPMQKTCRVELEDGSYIRTTLDHKFLTINMEGNYEWIEAQNLEESGNLVCVNMHGVDFEAPQVLYEGKTEYAGSNARWDETIIATLTPDICELLGQYIGDGNYNRTDGHDTTIAFGADEKDSAIWYMNVINKIRPDTATLNRVPPKDNKREKWKVRTSHGVWRNLLENLGLACVSRSDKRLPKCMWRAPRECREACLRGLFDSDGHISKNSTVGFTTISEELAREVQQLLRSVGIFARIKDQKTCWRVFVCSESKDIFRDRIGFRSIYKQERLNQFYTRGKASFMLPRELSLIATQDIQEGLKESDVVYVRRIQNMGKKISQEVASRITATETDLADALFRFRLLKASISDIKEEKTYDLTVHSSRHALSAEGITVHNCGADFAKISIGLIDRLMTKLKMKSRLCLMIHDELIVLAPKSEAYVVKRMLEELMTVDLFGITLDVDAEIKLNLSKSAPDISKPMMKVVQPKKDEKGETVYKDGKPVEEVVEVPTPGYIPPPGQLEHFVNIERVKSNLHLNEMLQPIEKGLDSVRSILIGALKQEDAEEEIEDLQELIPD